MDALNTTSQLLAHVIISPPIFYTLKSYPENLYLLQPSMK